MNVANWSCSRCGRRAHDDADAKRWNAMLARGVIVGFLCPDCQTPEENAEAEINLATVDYGWDSLGRVTERPKIRR